jgi:hypothetical protein
MGKKTHSSGNVSKGERRSSMKTGSHLVLPGIKMIRKLDALEKGKDVTFTIENPNKTQTNRRYIKYKVRGKDYAKYISGGKEMKGARNPLFSTGAPEV